MRAFICVAIRDYFSEAPDSLIHLNQIGRWTATLGSTVVRRALCAGHTTGYIGWSGRGNLGDDVMFEAAAALLPTTNLEVFSGARREAMLAGVHLSGSSSFDRVVLGGGTLINDGYRNVAEQAVALGLPVRSFGTGVGGCGFGANDNVVEPQWRDVLARFERVGVRGPRSADKLTRIGIEKAEVIGDLALALTPDVRLGAERKNRFLLNVAVPDAYDARYPTDFVCSELADAARCLASHGWRATAVAFCTEDIAPLKRVLREAGIDTTKIVQPRTARAFFELARGAGLAIGVRLHCSVLACCAGVAPLGIAYRDKGHDFAATMGLADWMIDPLTMRRGMLAERAISLSGENGERLGQQVHAKAFHWRSTLRKYAADV